MNEKIKLWRKIRKEKGLTNQQISELSGIPMGSIKNLFAGYTENPRIDTVNAIEKALGISDNLWTEDDLWNGVTLTKKINISPDEEVILDKFREVYNLYGEKGLDLVVNFMDLILTK